MKKWILLLLPFTVVLLIIALWFIFWFIEYNTSKTLKFIPLSNPSMMTVERRIPAGHIYALLSADKNKLAIVREGVLSVYLVSINSNQWKQVYDTLPPTTYEPTYFIWTFFWVDNSLLFQSIFGLYSSAELEGMWTKYENASSVILAEGPSKEKVIIKRASLYWGFVPYPNEQAVAVLTHKEQRGKIHLWKGFLYSLSDRKKLREIAWAGPCIQGPYYDTSNFPPSILFWSGDGKTAWAIMSEYIHRYNCNLPILVSLDFNGNCKKLNGERKGEWLVEEASRVLYTQPNPDRCAVIITKSINSFWARAEKFYIAHYSSERKVWEARIPWEEIQEKFKHPLSIIAVTHDGKGIIFQEQTFEKTATSTMVGIWIWRVGERKTRFITKAPIINQAIGWLDRSNLLVIAGTDAKRVIGIIKSE